MKPGRRMKNAIEGLLGLPDTVLTSIALMLPQRDRCDACKP